MPGKLKKKLTANMLFVKSAGNLFRTTAPTQDMLLWPGIELIGCARTSSKIVNGVIYYVTEITEEKVTVVMADEFRSSLVEMTNEATMESYREQLLEKRRLS